MRRAAIAAPLISLGRVRMFGAEQSYSTRAVDLVKRSTVIDMLSPFTLSNSRMASWMTAPETFTAADLQEFRNSGINAFHIAIGMGGPEAYLNTYKFVSQWNSFLAYHNNTCKRIQTTADIGRAKAANQIGVIIGLQNSEHFRRLDDINEFYRLGQRVSQLTYNARNMIGNGSTERHDEGLSDYGVAVVGRMNQVGMVVDVSHCGDRTTLDALDVSARPVLFTHIDCRALSGHVRSKTDEAIRKCAEKGGVMGITGVRMFVKADEPTTVEDYLNHFDHIRKLVGAEFLGIGSDIDLHGYDAMPEPERRALHANYKAAYKFREKDDIEGINHPKRMFDVAEGLIRRKYSDAEIEGILGGNFQRVLKQIWGD
ncbi:MAG TPA: membrane dipeptidase [Bryobacteraceae bacterium]